MDVSQILIRIKSLKNLDKDKDIAPIIGWTPSNFSNRKRKGSLLAPITEWAEKEGIDLNWLLRGESTQTKRPELRETVSNFGSNSFEARTNRRLSALETKIDNLIETFSVPDVPDVNKEMPGEK